MPSFREFTLESLQASIFLPETNQFSKNKIVATILTHFANVFDGEMQVLPIPDEMPAEIPRVVLQSADGSRRFNAGKHRADFVNTSPQDLRESCQELSRFISTYVEEMGAPGRRLALVVNRSVPSNHPAQTLISAFCNERARNGPFARSATFEIHNHKEFRPLGLDYEVNSWVRCTCRKTESNESIAVMQDLNTLAKDDSRFDEEQVGRFFSAASDALDEILARYFPD